MATATTSKALYIHDDGSVTCVDHAPYSAQGFMQENPRKKIIWTPRGTWEKATNEYREYFKTQTGVEMDCETCTPFLNAEGETK
jgi:hypothetical protein